MRRPKTAECLILVAVIALLAIVSYAAVRENAPRSNARRGSSVVT
jgi:hypothetical protein